MKLVSFTHLNLGTTIFVDANLVFASWYSEGHKGVLIESIGGALLPVKESLDSVKVKIEEGKSIGLLQHTVAPAGGAMPKAQPLRSHGAHRKRHQGGKK